MICFPYIALVWFLLLFYFIFFFFFFGRRGVPSFLGTLEFLYFFFLSIYPREQPNDITHATRTVNEEPVGPRDGGSAVVGPASVVAVVLLRHTHDHEGAVELVHLVGPHLGLVSLILVQGPAVLQPLDRQRRVAVAHHAGDVHPAACLHVLREAKLCDARWYCACGARFRVVQARGWW